MSNLNLRPHTYEPRVRTLIALALLLCALVAPPSRSRPQPGRGAGKNYSPVPPDSSSTNKPKLSPDSSSTNEQTFSPGQLVERVVSLDDATQSYALYLPSGYTPGKRWPILYCLDPLARGEAPVARFREAAERHGWIVAGSHNSRNGPVQASLDAAAAMWRDTRARLSVDERRVYAAGFSGGARTAVRFGHLCRGCLAGVVLCGAGFPADIKPSAAAPFPVYSVAGIDDYNFPELKKLDEALDKISVAHRLATFDGAHAWPPADACAAALEWMELQAVKSGRLHRDDALIERLWLGQTSKARDAEAARNFYDAYLSYRAAANDFRGLRDVTRLEREAARLRETREVGTALADEAAQIGRQHKLAAELVALLEQRRDPARGAVAGVSFRKAVDDLRKAARAAGDTGERRIARRTLSQVFAQFYEGAHNLLGRRENYALAAASLAAAAELAPDNAQVVYELARAHALNRDKRRALAALRQAVERGFKDVKDMAANEAFDSLRGEAEYREIVEAIGQKQ
jgi:predicted esterase